MNDNPDTKNHILWILSKHYKVIVGQKEIGIDPPKNHKKLPSVPTFSYWTWAKNFDYFFGKQVILAKSHRWWCSYFIVVKDSVQYKII